MKEDKVKFVSMDNPNSFMSLAFIRDGDLTYTNEAVYIACLLHASGGPRTEEAEKKVARMMDDINQ